MALVRKKIQPYYPLGPSKTRNKLIAVKNVRFLQRELSPFHALLCEIAKNATNVCKRAESYKTVNILRLLDEIIPMEYFGTKKHKKLFYKIVTLILTRSSYECIYKIQLCKCLDSKMIPWLNNVQNPSLGKKYFIGAQIWLLDKIVKPLISKFYRAVRRGQTHEVELVPKRIWTSFEKKVIHKLQQLGHLVPETNPVVPRGFLQVRPKGDYDDPSNYRIIMNALRTKVTHQKQMSKHIIKCIYAAAERMCSTKSTNIYLYWKRYVAATGGQKLYGVKVDVRDAFGNINIDSLCGILETECQKKSISTSMKTSITNHIQNQYVIYGRNKQGSHIIWRWNHGLLQGDQFSSALCQLHMSFLDAKYLSDFYKSNNFLHRTVDDYFFCSTVKKEVQKFLDILSTVYVINEHKTESNLFDNGNYEIRYCGQIFNMKSKEVNTLYNIKKGTEVRHRYRFWNIEKPIYFKQQHRSIEAFLQRTMTFKFNNFRFKRVELNTVFNTESTIMKNYFEAMIFLAFKFDAALMAIKSFIVKFSFITMRAKKIVHKYAHKAFGVLLKNKGQHDTGFLNFKVLLKIGMQAFILVLKKRSLYNRQKVIPALEKYNKKIQIKGFPNKYQKMPTCFNNICIKRRFSHAKQ